MHPADVWVRERRARKQAQQAQQQPQSTEETYQNESLVERSDRLATPEQKAQLDNIQKNENMLSIGHYNKQILTIMGELPEDTPRLTMEQVTQILDSIEPSDYGSNALFMEAVFLRFNEIAGAPDFEGGSGTHWWVYYLNESGSEFIAIRLGVVSYYPNGLDGEHQDLLAAWD